MTTASPGRALQRYAPYAAIVIVSLAVRVAHLISVYSTPAFSFHRFWTQSDMYIFDQWARRIVAGDFLGRTPYNPILDWMRIHLPTGNWAQWFGHPLVYFKAPFYAYLIAALRWLFGDPMLPVAILQILASTLCAVLLFLLTQQMFGGVSGLLAALTFAVYGPAIHYDVVMLRGPWIVLTALLVSWLLARLMTRPTTGAAGQLGLAVGVALLVNEGCLMLPVFVGAVVAWSSRGRSAFRHCVAFSLGGLAVIAPVMARNVSLDVPPLRLAATGGFAYALCNAADSDALFFRLPPPSILPILAASDGRLIHVAWECLRSFHSVGEFIVFYGRRASGLLAPFENPDTANFYYAAVHDPLLQALPGYALLLPLSLVGLCLAGVRLKRTLPLWPSALAVLLPMLATFPLSRYRVVFAAFLCPFSGVTLARIVRWLRLRRYWVLAAAAASMVAMHAGTVWVQRHVVGSDAALRIHMYRQPEFMVAADIYAKANRPQDAVRELQLLSQLNPTPTVRSNALLRAARLQMQVGDLEAARRSLRTSYESNPMDARTAVAIGDVYWQNLKDPRMALVLYRRAQQLRPRGALAAGLRQRLTQLERRFPP